MSKDEGTGPRWWDRFLLSFMGPPNLGDPDEPPPNTSFPDPVCPSCGRVQSEHVVREPGLTYTRCPT